MYVRKTDNAKRLALAIVMRAAYDYQMVLCGEVLDKESSNTIEDDRKELIEFFHSDYFRFLADVDGDELMERLEQECRKCEYDYSRVAKNHYNIETVVFGDIV